MKAAGERKALFSEDDLVKLAQASTAMVNLSAAWEKLTSSLGIAFAPALSTLVHGLEQIVDYFNNVGTAIGRGIAGVQTGGAFGLVKGLFFKPDTSEVDQAINNLPKEINIPVYFTEQEQAGGGNEYLRYASSGLPGTRGGTSIPRTFITPYSYASGGVVPGAIGEPVPIIAHGGEEFAGVGKSFEPSINVTVNGSILTERELSSALREVYLDIKRRNGSTGF